MTSQPSNTIVSSFLPHATLEYPETDGQPMAETDFQRKPLTYCVEALAIHFANQADVYVSGNLMIYYEEGNPRKSFAPDVFVVLGIPDHPRPIYKTWDEGKAPDVIIEILSRKTWNHDRGKKKNLYRQLGVKEYFLFDPIGDFLDHGLEGFWLDEEGQYQPLSLSRLPDGGVSLDSHLLGVGLHVIQGQLQLYDLDHQRYLLTHQQEYEARLQATQRAETEYQARVQATQRAEKERTARLQATQRAETEYLARVQAEQQTTMIVKNLRQQGFSVEAIAQMTGLSTTDIEALNTT